MPLTISNWMMVLATLLPLFTGALLYAAEKRPLDIGTRTCLFLDDRFIAEQSNLKRTWH